MSSTLELSPVMTNTTTQNEPVLERSVVVTVDYDLSIDEAEKQGKYDADFNNLKQNGFPTKLSGRKEVTLDIFHFDPENEPWGVPEKLETMGYRAAEYHELLALGATHPDLQREYPIIALGTIYYRPDVRRDSPMLDSDGSKRILTATMTAFSKLQTIHNMKFVTIRVLAVRK